ncbi:MAG: lysostaphin resistance A-like protein, partial [Candidatus Saccharimonadales bacterium]
SSMAEPKPAEAKASIPWNPLLAVVFVVITYFAAQILASIVVGIYPTLRGWDKAQALNWTDTSIIAQFSYMLIASALVVGAVYQFLKLYGQSWKAIGFRRPQWADLGMGLAIAPLYYLSYFVTITVAGKLAPSLNVNQAQQLGFSPVGPAQLILTCIALVILPPLMEETLMRGFLYTSLKKGLPQLAAALVTSAIFASAHLQAGSGAPLLWVAAIDTFVLSLFLIWLREKTGSLWASMTLHALKNSVAFLSLSIFHFR